MNKTYRLELDVTLDEIDESQAVQIAREYYRKTGGAEEPVGKRGRRHRTIPPGEFVSGIKEAIMELVGANDLLKKAGIKLVGVTCLESDSEEIAPEEHVTITDQRSDGSIEEDAPGPGKGALDEFETRMYLCRWPNGEFSVVMAPTRRDALIELDEWAPGYPSLLFPMDSCMVDFGLNDDGGIELNQLGEDTEDFIWKTASPALDEARHSKGAIRPDGEYTAEGKELIRKAVVHERTRLRDSQLGDAPAETEAGKDLQKQLGMAGPVADHYIQERAKRILQSDNPKKGKPN